MFCVQVRRFQRERTKEFVNKQGSTFIESLRDLHSTLRCFRTQNYDLSDGLLMQTTLYFNTIYKHEETIKRRRENKNKQEQNKTNTNTNDETKFHSTFLSRSLAQTSSCLKKMVDYLTGNKHHKIVPTTKHFLVSPDSLSPLGN